MSIATASSTNTAVTRTQVQAIANDLLPRLQSAYAYVTSSSSLPDSTEGWDLDTSAPGSKMPLMIGVPVPQTPCLFLSPFAPRADRRGSSSQVATMSRQTFLWNSEKDLKALKFKAGSAKFLSYVRLLLLEHGCCQQYTETGKDRFYRVQCSMRAPQIDEVAMSKANLAWPSVILAGIGAFLDNDRVVTAKTCDLAQKYWSLTPWRSLLKVYEIEWWHIFKYVLQLFSLKELVVAVTGATLSGNAAYAPILDVVEDEISEAGFFTLFSIWGVEGGKLWWKAVTSYASEVVSAKRVEMAAEFADYPKGSLPEGLDTWVETDLPGYLDVLRIVVPLFEHIVRPIYLPQGIMNLALNPGFDVSHLAQHAKTFADTLIDQGFTADGIAEQASNIASLSHPSFKAWWKSPITSDLPAAGTSATYKRSEEKMQVLTILPAGDETPATPSTAIAMVDHVPEFDPEVARKKDAIAAARHCIFSETYSISQFEAAVTSDPNEVSISSFWKPELKRARQVYREAMGLE